MTTDTDAVQTNKTKVGNTIASISKINLRSCQIGTFGTESAYDKELLYFKPDEAMDAMEAAGCDVREKEAWRVSWCIELVAAQIDLSFYFLELVGACRRRV